MVTCAVIGLNIVSTHIFLQNHNKKSLSLYFLDNHTSKEQVEK